MLTKLAHAFALVREAWLVARVPAERRIFSHLRELASVPKPRQGFAEYLAERPARGRIEIVRDWYQDGASDEARLDYSSSLFAPGCLRYREGPPRGDLLVFLPGNTSGAQDVMGERPHPQRLVEFARDLGMGLACWDWALQGARLEGALYRGLGSLYSAEREYSRILPALGTSLWREMVEELRFALAALRERVGNGVDIHVVGWSMGGSFAYVAPLLVDGLRSTLAAGSCARIADLLAEGETRRHGFFFYPVDAWRYFDLDDIVGDVLASGHRLGIVHGDRDPGCLVSSVAALAARARSIGVELDIVSLRGRGHSFSEATRIAIADFLRKPC